MSKKAVLASIKPKYCELIASRKKTVEIRKNRPKIDVPFKCYIYCTAGKEEFWVFDGQSKREEFGNGKVIGEFVCDKIQWNNASDLWIAEDAEITLEGTCLTKEDMYKYLGVKSGTSRNDKKYEFYGWHISDLVIYDTTKELSEFHFPSDRYCEKGLCGGCPHDCTADVYGDYDYDCEWKRPLTRPPQSWCYVEELSSLS